MPRLNDTEVTYNQILELVDQLDFEKKMALLRDVIQEKEYRKNFYLYTEDLTEKFNIPEMNEDELDVFLHENN